MTQDDLYELINQIEDCPHPTPYYFVGTVGCPDKYVIEYFQDCNDVIVLDRKGRKWRAGKRVYDNVRNNNT